MIPDYYTEPPEEDVYICPKCGQEIPYGTELFFDENNECVGCEECLTKRFVEDYQEEQDYYKGGAI